MTQVTTRTTTIDKIMASPFFERGVNDARTGRGFAADYDTWHGNEQWDYERGRQFGKAAPRTALKREGRITPEARKRGEKLMSSFMGLIIPDIL